MENNDGGWLGSYYPELLEKIRKYAMSAEKKERFEHSVRVAQFAEYLCVRYSQDARKGYLAGLAHDVCKDLADSIQLSLAGHDGRPILDVERRKPSLLHGRAAAQKLERDFGVTDPDVIQAVALHTLGGENMCPLAKIVYVADKIEPGRPQSSPEYRDRLLQNSLDGLTLAVLEENMDYLRKRGKVVAPVSLVFRQSLLHSIQGECSDEK